jgi:hypothetical protein
VPLAADRHLVLLHRLQEGRLGLGRRAVDLVGQNHVGKDRSRQEAELARAGRLIFLNYFGACDVRRHQVGRELDAVELEVQGIRHGADHQRLGQPRHTHQKAVPAGKHRHEQFLDDLLLPDNNLGQFAGDLAICFT